MGLVPQNVMAAFGTESLSLAESAESGCSSDPSQPIIQALSVRVADSFSAVEALRPVWKTWTHSLNTDLDYYLHNVKVDPTIRGPYVVTVWGSGSPVAMLVGRIRRRRVSTVVSSVNIYGPKANVLELVAGGRIGRQSAAIDALFIAHIRALLRDGSIDMVCFQRLPLQSQLFYELQCAPGLLKERVPHIFRYSVVPLTAAPGEQVPVFSGKNRREVRRKTRILERALPDQARYRCFSATELEAGLKDCIVVDATSWQHSVGYGLLNNEHAKEDLEFCAKRGWLRIFVMYLEDSPVAFLIGQHFQKTFYCQYAGYRPDFARYSVGSLLTAWAFERMAAAGIEQADLGEGSQVHNHRLGCYVYEEGTVHLYSPSLRGLSISTFFGATDVMRASGRWTRESLGLHWPAKIWKQQLIRRHALSLPEDSEAPDHVA